MKFFISTIYLIVTIFASDFSAYAADPRGTTTEKPENARILQDVSAHPHSYEGEVTGPDGQPYAISYGAMRMNETGPDMAVQISVNKPVGVPEPALPAMIEFIDSILTEICDAFGARMTTDGIITHVTDPSRVDVSRYMFKGEQRVAWGKAVVCTTKR